jgi:hypothetical protein
MKRLVNNIIGSALISFLVLTGLCSASPSAPTVEDLYPGLAFQSLKFAQPAKLPIGEKVKADPVTENELRTFYNENRDLFGGAPPWNRSKTRCRVTWPSR